MLRPFFRPLAPDRKKHQKRAFFPNKRPCEAPQKNVHTCTPKKTQNWPKTTPRHHPHVCKKVCPPETRKRKKHFLRDRKKIVEKMTTF